MRSPTFAFTLPIVALLLLGGQAAADDPIIFDQVTSKWSVAENGTCVVNSEVSIRAPRINASHVVSTPLTWSASTEKLTVVQARIDRPDGSSIVMGPKAIRDDPLTGDEYFHEFSDRRRLLITFHDAQPGDILVIKTRRDVFRPWVPGGFTVAPVLDRSVGWGETNYTFSIPSDMPFQFETRGFDHQSELIKDRMMHYMHLLKFTAPAKQVTVLSDFDLLPRFAISTFRDWDEFGTAYASVLLPHAKVTPVIAAMAAKLTEGQQPGQQGQAVALYEWVRDHIRYIPIPLDEGRPDPNDAEQVLNKLYGDDKDHVVLLYALLAARNIPAEFVLLNDSTSATIADPPTVPPMNHLILFLPNRNVYIDSTLRDAPFGVLAFGEIGKPAIHLGGSGLARRTIPIPSSGDTRTALKTVMTFGADGTVSGTTTTTANGAFGILLRNAARWFGKDSQAAAITLLRQHGTPGTGTFSFDPPDTRGNIYSVRGKFQLENQSDLLRGGFFAPWTGLRILPRPGDVLGGPLFARDLSRSEPTFCHTGIESEELDLTIPEGRALSGLPPDLKIDSELVHYRSHWSLNGQVVSVSREFQSLATGPVCEREVREDMADVLSKIRTDLLNPIGIKQDKLPGPPEVAPDSATNQ